MDRMDKQQSRAMDKPGSPPLEKRESRPMDKPNMRQAELDARHEGIAWRNAVRKEDKEWRETTREEDKVLRATVRAEDKTWRAQVRDEDDLHRLRTERTTKRCCALSVAAEASKAGASPEAILSLAKQFEDWLNSKYD